MIYIDPPYGIKYGSNFQPFVNKRDVKDGSDEDLTQEPEMVKAFRDTWELGIHSYLAYLRDRLLLARELLHESGSVFVQISDENVHLVREIMDEVFGKENFISLIIFTKTTGLGQKLIDNINDFIIWYTKDKATIKYHPLFQEKIPGELGASRYTNTDKNGKLYTTTDLRSQSGGDTIHFEFEYQGRKFSPHPGFWKTTQQGMIRLQEANRR